ncbi:hypothetical protein CK203_071754 [Vitis vinifera]|uniref:Uncharacterized protein n=1 Tax=Vitis vinifera TaxID=29760 RepID=A0A438C329_VITVI|nr:hypothetical protein CK203_071754 [Vitis vinifera]
MLLKDVGMATRRRRLSIDLCGDLKENPYQVGWDYAIGARFCSGKMPLILRDWILNLSIIENFFSFLICGWRLRGFETWFKSWWVSYYFRGSFGHALIPKLKALKENLKVWNKEVSGMSLEGSNSRTGMRSRLVVDQWRKIRRGCHPPGDSNVHGPGLKRGWHYWNVKPYQRARLTLLRSILSNWPIYLMSLLVIPRLVQLSVKRFKGISFEKCLPAWVDPSSVRPYWVVMGLLWAEGSGRCASPASFLLFGRREFVDILKMVQAIKPPLSCMPLGALCVLPINQCHTSFLLGDY